MKLTSFFVRYFSFLRNVTLYIVTAISLLEKQNGLDWYKNNGRKTPASSDRKTITVQDEVSDRRKIKPHDIRQKRGVH